MYYFQFEFSSHYNEKNSPLNEFGKWFFSDDWNYEDWNNFYNYMCFCLYTYFVNGIICAESINLERRKLIEHTNEDFLNWMDEQVNSEQIVPNERYEKKELHRKFLENYPEFKEKGYLSSSKNFTKCLVNYITYSGEFGQINKAEDIQRSGGKDYIIFRPKDLIP